MWFQRHDMLTRSKMAALIRRGYAGASALSEALKQCHLEWHSPALQASWYPEATQQPSSRKTTVPEPEHGPAPKRPRQIKADPRRTVSMLKGGRALCKAFNDQRGCKGCDKLHACDVRLPSGEACQSTRHNRLNHPE